MSGPPKPILRTPTGQIVRGSGQLPGSGGKPDLVALIREATNDTRDLVRTMVGLADGTIKGQARDRFDAARWLLERLHGKTPDVVVTATAQGSVRLNELADEYLETLARSLRPLERQATGQATVTVQLTEKKEAIPMGD